MAWHLAQQGRRFLVLEAGPEVGHVWRSRWDSLKLVTPAQYDALPGMAFPAPADTYPTKDPVADYLQAYVTAFNLPVRLNARATRLSKTDDGFEVQTADSTFRARQVVVATGPFQVPFVPPQARGFDPSWSRPCCPKRQEGSTAARVDHPPGRPGIAPAGRVQRLPPAGSHGPA
jgi:putative flavoprotein involved in K+ transport